MDILIRRLIDFTVGQDPQLQWAAHQNPAAGAARRRSVDELLAFREDCAVRTERAPFTFTYGLLPTYTPFMASAAARLDGLDRTHQQCSVLGSLLLRGAVAAARDGDRSSGANCSATASMPTSWPTTTAPTGTCRGRDPRRTRG